MPPQKSFDSRQKTEEFLAGGGGEEEVNQQKFANVIFQKVLVQNLHPQCIKSYCIEVSLFFQRSDFVGNYVEATCKVSHTVRKYEHFIGRTNHPQRLESCKRLDWNTYNTTATTVPELHDDIQRQQDCEPNQE